MSDDSAAWKTFQALVHTRAALHDLAGAVLVLMENVPTDSKAHADIVRRLHEYHASTEKAGLDLTEALERFEARLGGSDARQ